jgi:hypothetical protein
MAPFVMDAITVGAHFDAMGGDGLWLTDHVVDWRRARCGEPRSTPTTSAPPA